MTKACRSYQVRAECLAQAMADGAHLGVWGGTTERDRRPLRRDGETGTPAGDVLRRDCASGAVDIVTSGVVPAAVDARAVLDALEAGRELAATG